MGRRVVAILLFLAFVAGYAISFTFYKRQHYYMGLSGPSSISHMRWRVPDTAVHRALMTFYWPMRQIPGLDGPIDWI